MKQRQRKRKYGRAKKHNAEMRGVPKQPARRKQPKKPKES